MNIPIITKYFLRINLPLYSVVMVVFFIQMNFYSWFKSVKLFKRKSGTANKFLDLKVTSSSQKFLIAPSIIGPLSYKTRSTVKATIAFISLLFHTWNHYPIKLLFLDLFCKGLPASLFCQIKVSIVLKIKDLCSI